MRWLSGIGAALVLPLALWSVPAHGQLSPDAAVTRWAPMLNSIVTISRHEVFAAGHLHAKDAGYVGVWDGHSWRPSLVLKRDVGADFESLAAAGPRDVWALGVVDRQPPHQILYHWDGTTWTPVTLPAHSSSVQLGSMAASAGNLWISGIEHVAGAATLRGVIYHLSGSTWARQRIVYTHGVNSQIVSLTVSKAGSLWAVGSIASRSDPTHLMPLVLHYTGGAWRQQPTPKQRAKQVRLTDIGVSRGQEWAVGVLVRRVHSYAQVWHRSHGHWTIATVPGPRDSATLGVVSPDAQGGAWAAGSAQSRSAGLRTFIVHCTAALTCRRVPSPNVGDSDYLLSLSMLDSTYGWAVGQALPTEPPMRMRWDGTSWSLD